jgi:hypothetical protein
MRVPSKTMWRLQWVEHGRRFQRDFATEAARDSAERELLSPRRDISEIFRAPPSETVKAGPDESVMEPVEWTRDA